jgi:LuxR family transcriptional regulator, maltose regulon positive regulatory protein
MMRRLPHLPKRLLRRENVMRKLNGITQHALTVVCAPAGYGKTTAAIQAANELKIPFLYLELDDRHASAARFYGAILQGLRQIWPDCAPELELPLASSLWADADLIRETIVADMSERTSHFVTFFDDSSSEAEDQVHAHMATWLESLPTGMHVVWVSRNKPKFPLSRWRLKDQLLEIGCEDLTLEAAEAKRFLKEVTHLKLPDEQLEILHRLSEGWIAGLQMLALRLGQESDPEAAVLEVQKNHAFMFEYLMEEVLHKLPVATRDFLLATSVLTTLNPAACEALTDRPDAAALLADLSERNGFVTPREDGCFGYHRLFADGLRGLLRQRHPEWEPQLHKRAARWHLMHGVLESAFEHALEAGDADVLEALAARALENIFRNSDFLTLQRYAPRIPENFTEERPTLALFLAWTCFHLGREEAGRMHLERAQRTLREGAKRGEDGSSQRRLLAHTSFLRSILLRLSGDAARAMQLAYRACMLAPREDRFLRASLQLQIGIDAFLLGQLDVATAALEDAQELADVSEHHLAYYGAGYTLGEIFSLQGRLDKVEKLSRQLATYAGRSPSHAGPAHGYAALVTSRLRLLQSRPNDAATYVEAGIAGGRQGGNIRILNYGYAAQAMVHAQCGDYTAALPLLQQAEHFGSRNRMHWAIDLDDLEAMRLRYKLRMGEKADASTWLLRSRPRLRKPVLADWDLARTSVEVLLHLGRAAEALPLLDTWAPYLEKIGVHLPSAELSLLYAAVDHARGRKEAAIEKFTLGLRLCTEWGAFGVALNCKPWLKPLALAGLPEDHMTPEMKQLLALLARSDEAGSVSASAAMEALSVREIEVLQAMREGKSNKEIAVKLFVAPSTVKTHLKNIFAKMGVSNRTRAVTLAEEAGLLH